MYGTIMRAQVKKGQLEAVERLFDEQRANVEGSPGFHSTEFGREAANSGRFLAIIRFQDRESYVKNANRPETYANYRKMLVHLEDEPEWINVHFDRYFGRPLGERALAGTTDPD